MSAPADGAWREATTDDGGGLPHRKPTPAHVVAAQTAAQQRRLAAAATHRERVAAEVPVVAVDVAEVVPPRVRPPTARKPVVVAEVAAEEETDAAEEEAEEPTATRWAMSLGERVARGIAECPWPWLSPDGRSRAHPVSAQLDTERVTRAMLAGERPKSRRKAKRGSRHRLAWTAEENATLIREWGELTPRALLRKIHGRSWAAVLSHAKDALGLEMGVPQGEVTLTEAARRLGFYSAITVRKLAERQGVMVRTHPRPLTIGPKRAPHRCVDWDDIQEACAREVRGLESVRSAAIARGLTQVTLWRWLIGAGVISPPTPGERSRGLLRVESAEIDRVVNLHRAARAA